MSDEDMDDFEFENSVPETPKRGRGRPKGPPKEGERKVTTVTRQEFTTSSSDDDEKKSLQDERKPSLFEIDASTPGGGDTIVRIRVNRIDPDEGMVGYMENPEATESEILERWGGSTYKIQGLNERGKILTARTLRLAGDPIFVSESAQARWDKAQRQRHPAGSMIGVGQPVMSPTEMMAFLQEQDRIRTDREERQRERDRQAEREFAVRMKELDKEAEDRKRKAEEELRLRRERDEEERLKRQRALDEDRDERRKRDETEREERRRKDNEESRLQQQQFLTSIITMTQESAKQAIALATAKSGGEGGGLMETLKVIATVRDVFGGGGGGGESESLDPMSLIAKHGAEWLNALGGAVGGVAREFKGGGVAGAAAANAAIAAPRTNPALTPIPSPAGGGIPLTMLPASLAGSVQTLITKVAERGEDPEKFLSQLVNGVIKTIDETPMKGGGVTTPMKQQDDVQSTTTSPVTSPMPVAKPSIREPSVALRMPSGAMRMTVGKR